MVRTPAAARRASLAVLVLAQLACAYVPGGGFGARSSSAAARLASYARLAGGRHWQQQQQLSRTAVSASASALATPASTKKPSASLRVSSVNLLKNMVGAGVFSLNAKCTAIGPAAFGPASALVLTMAAWATYNFYMIAETCKLTSTTTYSEAWGRTVSENSKWIIAAVVTIAPIVSCLANSIVLTDILGLVYRSLGAPAWMYTSRNTVIALLSSTILYPLCVQQDLSALRSVSAFGLLGHFSAMTALAVRLLDKSYVPGGAFYSAAAGTVGTAPPLKQAAAVAAAAASKLDVSKLFVLASLLSYCFVCHYNAPRYYAELEGADSDDGTFLKMASLSYGLGACTYIGTMFLGLQLFGPRSASFALNSFSTRDPLGLVARVAFGSSVLASYPLIFLSMRNTFAAAAAKFSPNIKSESVTAALLALIAVLTSRFTDIGVVGSLAGGVFGSSMMFVFPPVMYMRALVQQARSQGRGLPVGRLVLNSVLLVCGGLLGGFGTYNSLRSALGR